MATSHCVGILGIFGAMIVDEAHVIVVNEHDEQMGIMDKMLAHREGVLHRAFSIFVFNQRGELLLQRRAAAKYHSSGLWSNTCCSHPLTGEDTLASAHRRLREELGFDCALRAHSILRYRAEVGNGLIENEVDHIFIGTYDGLVHPDVAEVADVKYVDVHTLCADMAAHPELYTAWLRLAIGKIF